MKNIICWILGHKYRLKRVINSRIREVKCHRCKREFGMNDDVKALLPMDAELYELHASLKQQLSKH